MRENAWFRPFGMFSSPIRRLNPGEARRVLVESLRREGIRDQRVLDALARVPREQFVSASQHARAYDNEPLPIGEGQTISQPFVVALMLEALHLDGSERVLEIGTGSGYQTALLADLAAEVVTVERLENLACRARTVLGSLGYGRVDLHVGDGSLGWEARAPYTAIVVSAGAPGVPEALQAQLAEGGRMVIPVGRPDSQELLLLTRTDGVITRSRLGPVRFVPLVGARAWAAPFHR